jgi:hypothetical protein
MGGEFVPKKALVTVANVAVLLTVAACGRLGSGEAAKVIERHHDGDAVVYKLYTGPHTGGEIDKKFVNAGLLEIKQITEPILQRPTDVKVLTRKGKEFMAKFQRGKAQCERSNWDEILLQNAMSPDVCRYELVLGKRTEVSVSDIDQTSTFAGGSANVNFKWVLKPTKLGEIVGVSEQKGSDVVHLFRRKGESSWHIGDADLLNSVSTPSEYNIDG